MNRSIWVGFDPRESAAFAVARHSIQRYLASPIPVRGLVLADLREQGLYTRPTSVKDGRMWDDISGAPCATEFSISRFLVPELVKRESKFLGVPRWALFIDCDFLAMTSVEKLFAICEKHNDKAVMVVKHHYDPPEGLKMDGQIQLRYARKNWSSCTAFNIDHEANKALTVDLVNSVPGRDLHAFCWLEDDQIGELDQSWNYLVGHTNPEIQPDLIHFTEGLPFQKGYENCQYAPDWWEELHRWAS